MSTSYVQIILGGGDSKKMQIALQKYNRFKSKKDDVLIEAFRAWFDAAKFLLEKYKVRKEMAEDPAAHID